mmetsp:Transcript_17532/g.29565  ORF Transcript_17532/g.29565 Transcript_17532/m.29565 type:complete len:175 (-) Transcript_17532:691-1215(-)
MKVLNAEAFIRLDNADVKELAGNSQKERKAYRMKIIKKFMKWSKGQDKERFMHPLTQSNNLAHSQVTERGVIDKQNVYFKSLLFFGTISNFIFYHAFMTGIYNYRITELVNMRHVPLPVKLSISTMVTGWMIYTLKNDSLYDEQLYQVAVKYRSEYDEEYNEFTGKNTHFSQLI